MAISWISTGTYTTSTSSISVPMPSGYQAGDFILLLIDGRNAYPALPSGWTDIGTVYNNDSSASAYFRACYKIAAASESNVTVADSGYQTSGITLLFRGVDTTSPIDVSGTSTSSGTAFSATGITTTVDNAMVVVAVGFNETTSSTDTTNYTSWANANLVSITEASDNIVTNIYGTGIASAYGIKTTAGATGTTTATADTSGNRSGTITFSLKPYVEATISGYWSMNGVTQLTSRWG